jgi:hypothetical protein
MPVEGSPSHQGALLVPDRLRRLLIAEKVVGNGEREVETADLGGVVHQLFGKLADCPSRRRQQQPLVEVVSATASVGGNIDHLGVASCPAPDSCHQASVCDPVSGA